MKTIDLKELGLVAEGFDGDDFVQNRQTTCIDLGALKVFLTPHEDDTIKGYIVYRSQEGKKGCKFLTNPANLKDTISTMISEIIKVR